MFAQQLIVQPPLVSTNNNLKGIQPLIFTWTLLLSKVLNKASNEHTPAYTATFIFQLQFK